MNSDDIESEAIAIGAAIGEVLKGALPESALKRFAELANLVARGIPEDFLDIEGEYIPLEFRMSLSLPSEPDNVGFTYVGNDTWLPTPLYEARNRRQRKTARKKESGIVWTR